MNHVTPGIIENFNRNITAESIEHNQLIIDLTGRHLRFEERLSKNENRECQRWWRERKNPNCKQATYRESPDWILSSTKVGKKCFTGVFVYVLVFLLFAYVWYPSE